MADKVQQEIERIDKSIGNLITKIANLKRELSSGDYGTFQLKEMQTTLDKLNSTLSRKQTKRASLVDERDTRELNRLNKSIETLQKRIEGNRGKLSLIKADDAEYNKLLTQIKNAERALNSLESRRQKRFDPVSGYRLNEQQLRDKKQPLVEMSKEEIEKRVNLNYMGISATNQELQGILRQSFRTKGILESLNNVRNYQKGSGGKLPPGYIPGGHPDQPPVGEGPTGPNNVDPGPSEKEKRAKERIERAKIRQANAEEKRAQKTEEEVQRLQKLADLRRRLRTEPQFQQYVQQLRERGLDVPDVNSAVDRGGGIMQVNASRFTNGVNNKFQGYVNQGTGQSTPGLSSQFRTFGSDILRDVGQFAKWSIAVAAVYTPLQKLGELMAIMVDNESRLADAAIAANVPFEKSGEIFDGAAVAANRAGESINGVIDAYAQAIRAAGRYTDENVKTQKATELLNDSLILSKLSTLDQSSAIDTLSAALLQSGRELDQGQELLNKWVRVSQIANVSIDTLATGVAVLGDAAETSGVSIDELNGLIAVLAEQSISGSKEAANTAKALVGAYQGDKAEQTLNKYGIALKKANGEARGFLEIYRDLAKLRQEGVLSETAVSEIAIALGGGGSRRAKDASALINSMDRLNDIAAESSTITDEQSIADDALAKKLETVQTANTKLSNSFQELAQTLGDDGGLLDLFKALINSLTFVVSQTENLFDIMGRSGPVLATFTTGLLALKAINPNVRQTLISNLAGPTWGNGAIGDIRNIRQTGLGGIGRGIASDVLQMNYRGAGILGGASVIGAGLSNLQAGKNEQALANVIGGVLGGAIGATLGGPVGLAAGATIGSSAGDSFVTFVQDHSQDLRDYFAPPTGLAGPGGGGGGTQEQIQKTEATTEELLNQLYKITGGGNEFLGGLGAKLAFGLTKITPGQNYQSPDAIALEALRKRADREGGEAAKLLAQLEEKFQVQTAAQGFQPANISEADKLANERQIQNLQRLAEQERARQLEKVSTGELRPSEFSNITERLSGFPTAAKQTIDAFGQSFIDLSKDVDTTAQAYDAFLELTVNGSAEQQAQINQYISDIQKLQAAWDHWTPGEKTLDLTTGSKTFTSRDELGKQLALTQQQAAQYSVSAITNARLQQLKLPGIVGSATEATTGGDADLIKQQAEKLQDQFYTDMNLTVEQIEYLRKGLEDFTVLVERAGEDHFETISGIDQKFWDAAQKLLSEQGKLKDERGIGFQKFDLPMSMLEQLAARSLQIGQTWQQKYNYDYRPEDQIAIDNQGIVQPLHADFKILALLLEKIVDQNQKQLDGQYNIPEGATFWVPLTAAYYRRGPGGEGGDLQSMLDSLAVDENTGATNANTAALSALTLGLAVGLNPPAIQKGPLDEFKKTHNMEDYVKLESRRGAGAATREGPRGAIGVSEGVKVEQPKSAIETGIQELLMLLRTIFQPTGQTQGRPLSTIDRNQIGQGNLGGGISNRTTPTTAPTSPTAKLDLKISSNVNLMVDGRILASTLQNYLASELLRTEQSQGTITKRYVI